MATGTTGRRCASATVNDHLPSLARFRDGYPSSGVGGLALPPLEPRASDHQVVGDARHR